MNKSQESFAECSTFKKQSKRRNKKKRSIVIEVTVTIPVQSSKINKPNESINSNNVKKESMVRYVTTKKNNGSEPKNNLSNQCFWISIRDFLHSIGRNDITLFQIRQTIQTKISKINNYHETISKKFEDIEGVLNTKSRDSKDIIGKNHAKLNGTKNMFDYIEHGSSAEALAEHHDISINVYCVSGNTLLTQDPIFIFGSGSRIVNVAYYGSHFEWISNFSCIEN
jgi:hypothetical protein